MDRRSILKLFGRGAMIAPMIDTAPLVSAAVRLVEPAKFELVAKQPSEADLPRMWADRLNHNPFERLWLARWRKEEASYHILEHLIGRDPTADERAVAAGLMQWFGTNCGLGFIHDTFRAEGYYLDTMRSNDNNRRLQDLYFKHPASWPEFVQLRMTGGPPEILHGSAN